MSRDRIIQLQECAENLGFSTIYEALDAGYHEVQDLVTGTFTLEKIDDLVEQNKAHEAWLKERDEVLGGLLNLMVHNVYDYDTVIKAYNFIKEQCHD